MPETKTKPYISVIIPAYNEGGRKGKELRKNLGDIAKYLGKKEISYEVVVVSDGSKDNTVDVANEYKGTIKNLVVIDRKQNRGKWYSVREGYIKAKGEYRLLTDADGATAIENLEDFWPLMKKGEDVIIGSRDLKAAKILKHQPKWKEFLGDAGNLLIQSLVGLRGIADTQCGFKVFSEEAVKKIVPQLKVDRWGGDFEMLALAKKMGYKINEVPVVWVDAGLSLVGVPGLGGYSSTLKELFQVKWRMITGQYKY
ncbi:MAG: glycosyltransferase family 2 protein [Candidatus Moranbacteria bacterium]|nr:glycosyltransferase family 2 protein [Candidatus Moranbacteria bacterium]